jgi:hypothetical protein
VAEKHEKHEKQKVREFRERQAGWDWIRECRVRAAAEGEAPPTAEGVTAYGGSEKVPADVPDHDWQPVEGGE